MGALGAYRLNVLNVIHPENQAGLIIITDDAELQLCLPPGDLLLRLRKPNHRVANRAAARHHQ